MQAIKCPDILERDPWNGLGINRRSSCLEIIHFRRCKLLVQAQIGTKRTAYGPCPADVVCTAHPSQPNRPCKKINTAKWKMKIKHTVFREPSQDHCQDDTRGLRGTGRAGARAGPARCEDHVRDEIRAPQPSTERQFWHCNSPPCAQLVLRPLDAALVHVSFVLDDTSGRQQMTRTTPRRPTTQRLWLGTHISFFRFGLRKLIT